VESPVIQIGNKHFLVLSESDEGGHYAVSLDEEDYGCNCLGWTVHRNCWHVIACRMYKPKPTCSGHSNQP
jgi:hypothetical protein